MTRDTKTYGTRSIRDLTDDEKTELEAMYAHEDYTAGDVAECFNLKYAHMVHDFIRRVERRKVRRFNDAARKAAKAAEAKLITASLAPAKPVKPKPQPEPLPKVRALPKLRAQPAVEPVTFPWPIAPILATEGRYDALEAYRAKEGITSAQALARWHRVRAAG